MKWAGTDLPPALITAVRSGFDVFVQLQRVRFSKYIGGEAFHPSAEGTESRGAVGAAKAAAVSSSYPETVCKWSELFLSRLKAIGEEGVVDPTAQVVWELVSVVIAILEEGGGDDGVNASAPYLEWYRARFVDVGALYRVRDTLDAVRPRAPLPPAEEADLFDALMGPYMVSIQRAFLAGLFPVAADLINSLVDYLRSCATDPFDAEEESVLTDVIRLLLEPPENSIEHREWMNTANGLIMDSKRILTASHDESGMAVQAAQQLRSLCLDLLLMASGDAALILQSCHLLELDVIDYVAAVCAVCEPYMTLRQVHHVYQNVMESWEGPVKGPWYVGVIEGVLGSHCIADLVGAMRLVGEAVRRDQCLPMRPGDDSNIVSSPSYSGDDADTDDADINEELDTNESRRKQRSHSDSLLFRRFALLFMAAHVADICAPPLGAAVNQIDVTFTRNELVEDFVSIFRHHPLLWRVAATYVVYSPFMNPAVLYRIVTERAPCAVSDRYTFLALHTFIHSSWEENSAFQVALRRLLHDKYPSSETLNKWIASLDYYRRKAVEVLHDRIIRERLACGDTAPAVWLAVECQQSKSLQVRLEQILRSPEALQNEEVYRVGEAVNNSFISVDTSASLRMLQVLRVCAALSEYCRARASLQDYNTQAGAAPDEDAMHWFLRAADKALRCAVSFRMHPVTVLDLAEQTADVALRLPMRQRPHTLIALLSHALELALTCYPTTQPKHAGQAAVVREKMMKLL
ncbi:hypothetical protein DQ04_01101120 [Trypanosoma grayi]|uniref:hypothetical protein n=1 Tax=Trypanosoma grayi TaxID=71804 RepID=UPI0004F4A5EE|nr:hypothetical protein DQ04_01101120 [Trypanosoma grayi]KEG13291.1 hypothetical protein DQ04_01101120 [Trypanosoma grayi]